MERLSVKTSKKREIVDITDDVEELLRDVGAKEGICNLFVTHTTAALTTAETEPGISVDMLDLLEAITPQIEYRHNHAPGHAPDHIISSVIGASVSVPVKDGQLQLGTYQRIVLIELNGPRDRNISFSFSKAE